MTMPERPDDLVRLNVAAKELGVTSKTVKKYCKAGTLHCSKLESGQWRVYRTALDQLKAQEIRTHVGTLGPMGPSVYFVRCQEFIKIGWTVDVTSRIQSVQTFVPWALQLIHAQRYETVPAAREAESNAHRALAEHRYRGEWFFDTPAVRAFIDALT